MGELVDARTAAERLGVDVRTLYAYVSRGSLRRVRGADGRSSRYDADELELLARRSRPRTLPRPAASIDLVIATRVSAVADGAVRYRGADVLDLVKAEAPFERVADLLWQAGPELEASDGWRAAAAQDRGAATPAPDLPVLQRFAIAVAALGGTTDSAVSHDTAVPEITAGAPAPDWPASGRYAINCLIAASGPASRTHNPADPVALRLWQRYSPLRPTAARVRALNTALVLLAEHELALSTLAVRVAASARAAPAGCLLAGLGTLSGRLHGGAARIVHERLRAGAPVTAGFGHPVHRHGDPRAAPLLDAVYAFATRADRDLIENARRQAPAPPNCDLALGALTYAARMPAEAPMAIFAVARTAGWIAHAAEEWAEPPLRFRGRAVRPRGQAAQLSRGSGIAVESSPQPIGQPLQGALVTAPGDPVDDGRRQPFAQRGLLPGVGEGDPGAAAGQLRQRVGPGGDPLTAGPDVALDRPRRALGLDDLDVDDVGAAADDHRDPRLRPDPAGRPVKVPVPHQVVGKLLVVGHDVEEVVHGFTRLRYVDTHRHRFHTTNGTSRPPARPG